MPSRANSDAQTPSALERRETGESRRSAGFNIGKKQKKKKNHHDACKWLTLSEAAGGKGGGEVFFPLAL